MILQKAAANDMAEIMNLVTAVFAGEQGIPAQLIPIPDEKEPQWWCAKENGRLAAVVALYREGTEWHMGRLAVSPHSRGSHVGTHLLEFALGEVFALGIDAIVAEARDTTVHILQKFGAEITGEATAFFNGNITPVILRKTAYEHVLHAGRI